VIEDGVMLRSQANLVASRLAAWDSDTLATARALLDRIAAQARAAKYREVRTRFAGCNAALLDELRKKFGVVAPFGGPTSSGMLTLHCPPAHVAALATVLRERGAETVSVAGLDYVFDRENPLFERLVSGLSN
jgi:ATP phosphoribosyltransferase